MGFNLMVEIKDDIPSYKKVKDYAKTANISVLPIFETDISTEIPPHKEDPAIPSFIPPYDKANRLQWKVK